MVKLGESFKMSSGGTPLKGVAAYYDRGTIPWLKSGEVAEGFVRHTEEFITDKALSESSAKVFPIDSVLVAMYGATAGQVGILKIDASTNQAVRGILPNGKAVPEFLYYYLKAQTQKLVELSAGGAQPNISQAIIRNLEFPLPPLATQQAIVAEIEAEQKLVVANRELISRFEKKIQATLARIWGEE